MTHAVRGTEVMSLTEGVINYVGTIEISRARRAMRVKAHSDLPAAKEWLSSHYPAQSKELRLIVSEPSY